MNTPQQEDMESSLREAKCAADVLVPQALLAMCLDFIVGDSNPREHDDERELVIDQLRLHLSPAQRSSNPQQEKNER